MPIARHFLVALSIAVLSALMSSSTVFAVTVEGEATEGPSNCLPFGGWVPSTAQGYTGFVYRNLPAFELVPGDRIRFDTMGTNDVDISLDIALAHTAQDGGWEPDGKGFFEVVTQGVPESERGDSVQGNFDLSFEVQRPFSFPGGGLIIRFKARGELEQDTTCTRVVRTANADDSSGLFVGRFFRDEDGVFPWADQDSSHIGVVLFEQLAPRVTTRNIELDEDRPTVLPLTDDVIAPGNDDPRVALTIERWPTRGTLEGVREDGSVIGGAVTYVPIQDAHGEDFIVWRATVDGVPSEPAVTSLTIVPVDDAPRAQDDAVTTTMGSPITLDVLANDSEPDGQELLVAIATMPRRGTVSLAGAGQLTYTPEPDMMGTERFDYAVTDGDTIVIAEVVVTILAPEVDAPPLQEPVTVLDGAIPGVFEEPAALPDRDAAISDTSCSVSALGALSFSGSSWAWFGLALLALRRRRRHS